MINRIKCEKCLTFYKSLENTYHPHHAHLISVTESTKRLYQVVSSLKRQQYIKMCVYFYLENL